jgi:hypothetical protein
VVFTGHVDRVEDELNGIRIGIVAEEFGGGFKLKLLQYIFQRIPIFGLRHAIGGMKLVHGKSVMSFNTMEELCIGVVRDISNEKLLKAISDNAYSESQSFLDPMIGVDILMGVE